MVATVSEMRSGSAPLFLALLILAGPGPARGSGPAIASRDLVVTVRPRTRGYGLAEVRHRGSGTPLAVWRGGPSLFEIELRAAGGRGQPLHPERLAPDYPAPETESVTVDERLRCATRSSDSRTLEDEELLTLAFRGCDVGDERGVLDITVRAAAAAARDGITWTLEVTDRSRRWGVWLVRFPMLRLVPPGGSPADDVLIYPRSLGRAVPNPYSEKSRRVHRFRQRRLGYPEQMNMPWTALLDPGRGGLYIGAHDPGAAHKRFEWQAKSDAVTVRVEHLPPHMGEVGREVTSVGPVITRWSPGHWWDAAQIYRAWALEQSWAAPAAVPAWYRQAPLVLVAWQKGRKVSAVLKSARRYGRFLEPTSPLPLIWYHWSELRPKETSTERIIAGTHAGRPFPAHADFGRAVARLERDGLRVQPYVNARVIDVPGGISGIPDEMRPWVVEDVNGRPRLWSPDWPGLIDTCRFGPYHRDLLRDIALGLTRAYGLKGVYLDQFGTLQNACFGQHGHPRGGGAWQAQAIRQTARTLRAAARSVEAEFAVTDENGADAFLDVRDGSLLHHDAWPGTVPLVPAVYGGRWIHVGYDLSDRLEDPVGLRVALAEQLVYGVKLGRLDVTTERWLEEDTIEGLRLIRRAARWRRAAAEWLDGGRLLRPLDLDVAVPEVTIAAGTAVAVTRVPGVMSGVWEASDGSVAFVLFNVTRRSLDATLTHDRLAGSVRLLERSLDGTETAVAPERVRDATVKVHLLADEIQLLVARPKGTDPTVE